MNCLEFQLNNQAAYNDFSYLKNIFTDKTFYNTVNDYRSHFCLMSKFELKSPAAAGSPHCFYTLNITYSINYGASEVSSTVFPVQL